MTWVNNSRVDAPVDHVKVENGAAVGVVLKSGEVIDAPIVISNADPKRSLVDLLEAGVLSPKVRSEAEHIDRRGSMARIHLLVDTLPDYVGFPAGKVGPQHQGLVILGASPAKYEKAWAAQQAGEFPDDYVLEALIPSVTDPTVAPAGLHTLSLGVQQLPFDLSQGTWETRKDEWADLVMEMYFRYAPNMRGHILGRHVITPLDLETTYNITGGNIFHMSMVGVENIFAQRPIPDAAGYRTPVQNYYLSGSGSHPGGGVTGAPGHNAAHRILADMAGKIDVKLTRDDFTEKTPGMIDGLLQTSIGQAIGYQIARSATFRKLTEKLNRTR